MRKFLGVVAAIGFAIPAGAETQSFNDFSGGLNTRISGVLLPENESPDLQNIVLDEIGAITRRKGFSKLNYTPVGGGSSDINAVYQLEQSDGDKYCIAFSSTNGYYSIDGCQTFTTFITTLTRNNDVNCDAYGDSLYCANNQYDFYFDGVNDIAYSGPSDLNFIRVFRNRCFGAGKDTNPSRLYWSNLGNCNTWTTSTDYVDIDAEDGDVITGIGPDLFNFLTVYKKFSAYLVQFDNANTANRKVINVSKSTGAKNHRSIINYNNRQYFSSVGPHGGQPGIYSTDGILVQEDSGKLRNSIDALSNYYSNIGRKTLDTKADWDAGTFDPYTMSASRDPGFMQSSYTAISETLSTDFGAGTLVNVSTEIIPGFVVLSSKTFSDDFTDGDYTTAPTWTVTQGGFDFTSDGYLRGTIPPSIMTSTGSIPYGEWRFKHRYGGTGACNVGVNDICFLVKLIAQDAYNYYSFYVRAITGGAILDETVGGVATQIGAVSWPGLVAYPADVAHNWTITRSTEGIFVVYVDGSFQFMGTGTAFKTSPGMEIVLSNYGGLYNDIRGICVEMRNSTGSYTSKAWDTYISTPIFGPFSSTWTAISAGNGIAFYTQTSTSADGEWSNIATTSDTLAIGSPSRRWVRQRSDFTTVTTTDSPRLDAWGVSAASTGTWRSDEIFLSNTMTGFGTFQTNQTVTGAGASIAYSMAVSTYAGGTASTGTFSVAPGSAISHSSGCYVVVLATFTVFSATETAKLDTITINWNEGTSAKSATMAVYKNRLHFCGQTGASTSNDVCYVRDTGGAWTRWSSVNARHLNVVSGSLVAGDSVESSGGYLYKLYDTDSDNGAAISAYWTSKDHPLGKIQNRKAIDRFYVIGSNDATTLTSTIGADTGLRTLAYDIDFSTGMTFKIAHKVIPSSLNGNVFRVKFGNNAASKPWSVLGYGLQYRDLGLMAP